MLRLFEWLHKKQIVNLLERASQAKIDYLTTTILPDAVRAA